MVKKNKSTSIETYLFLFALTLLILTVIAMIAMRLLNAYFTENIVDVSPEKASRFLNFSAIWSMIELPMFGVLTVLAFLTYDIRIRFNETKKPKQYFRHKKNNSKENNR